MTTELEGTTFAPTLEVSVPNNPDLPFTIVRLGTQYIQSTSSRNKLYTYDPVGGQDSSLYRESNRTSPLAKIVSTASNRVVAMNGSEPLYFDLVGRQVYDSLLGNLFGAYLKLGYVPIDGRTKYEFYTVPFGMEGTSVIVAPSNYPGTFPTPTAYKIQAAGDFIKDVVSLSYTDNSHRFSVRLDTAIDYTTDVAGQYFKLRTISTGNLDSLSIKFNKEVFTRHAAYSTSDDKLWLTGTTRWVDDSDITAGVPEVLKNVSYACFANAFATPGDSPITSVGNTGVMFVVVAGSAIRLYIATSSPYHTLNQFQAKLLVIHGPDTLGNIRLAGQTAQLSWDKDLVFYSPNAEAVDAGVAGFVYYTLVPKKLLVDNANPGKYIAKDFSWEADAAGITADQTNYTLQIFTCIQEPAELLGTIADVSLPSKDVAVTLNNATGIAPGSYVGLSLASSITLPSGWANVLQGSYKVSSVAGAVVHIEVNPAATLLETSPSVVTPPVGSTNTAMNMDGAAQLVDGVLSFGVVGTPTGIRAGDFVYCVFRDTDEASVSLQLTGWFEVDSTEAGWISVKYPLASGNSFDMGAISSVRLAYILALNNSVTGVIKVPIPVPHKLDMVDLAAPHFDQNADTRVTPLALVMRRLALGMNQVLNKVGFAYWGGAVGSIAYPSNGFRHIAHKYPVNRYPGYRPAGAGWDYYITPIPRAAYDAPFDIFTLAGASGYYALNGSVNTNDVYRNEAYVSEGVTTEKTFTHREDQYPSRLWYTSPVSQNIVRAARIAAFNYKSYLDINSGDGEAITGATPYQDSLLVFKTNSIWRVTFDENGFPSSQRVQATVGSIAGKSIVAFERGVMFIHSTGIYVTDGVNIETITELSRAFGERVQQNQGLLSEGAGHVDPITKEVYLGVPYSTAENTYAIQSDAAFVYNYNSVVLGWSVNTNTPAVWWTRIANKDYFCSQEGKVFRVRYETGLQKYRDFTSPVVMKLVTRYVDESQANRFKFYRNAIFQFGNDCARNMKIAYGTNYSMVPVDLPVIPVKSHRFGTEEFGRGMYGTNSWLSPTRRGLGPGRVAQLSFTIVDDTLDSSGSLYLVAVEGQVTNSKLVPQTSMVRGR